jgi:CubicO group peptidase (beta-lactamase class C family)
MAFMSRTFSCNKTRVRRYSIGKEGRPMKKMWIGVVLLCSATLVAQTALSKKMDMAVQAYVDRQEYMGSVLVVKHGRVLLNRGYGMADMEWGIPNAPDTVFRMGSITKQFTAASILLLEERGKLKIDDPVSKYLPDMPRSWEKITLYNLLTHTSGIPNNTEFPTFASFSGTPKTRTELLAEFRDLPLQFESGTQYHYSNSGYDVLGFVIERVSGQDWGTFLQQNIFGPVGMKQSRLGVDTMILPHRAVGYDFQKGEIIRAGYASLSVSFAAGAVHSTTGDLLKWEKALFGGKILSAESLKKMTTPNKERYGFGVEMGMVAGHRTVMHSGSIYGFQNYMTYFPDEDLNVIVLGNESGAAPTAIMKELSAIALGQ